MRNMTARERECLCWSVSISFVLGTLVLFVGLIGLATAGIISTQTNDIDDSLEGLMGGHFWALLLVGASIAAVPFAVFGTAAGAFLVEAVKATRIRKKSAVYGIAGGKQKIDTIAEEDLYHFNGAELASMSIPAMITVFVSLLTSAMALLGILWGIAIAHYNAVIADKSATVYLLVEVLVGLLAPIMTIISAALMFVHLEYITQGSLDARVLIARLLPAVKLVHGEHTDYWVIENRFYFEINKLDTPKQSDDTEPCSRYCSRTPATWILATIVSLAFLLTATYFMSQNITTQTTVRSCPHSSLETDCFNQTTFEYINCHDPKVANTTFEQQFHCFRFLRLGRDSDIIGGVSSAFAFYLATLAFFTIAFHFANVLINILPTKKWGVGFIFVSVLIVGAGMAMMFTQEALWLLSGIVQVFQLFMVAIIVFLIGLLLLVGKWWESDVGQTRESVSLTGSVDTID